MNKKTFKYFIAALITLVTISKAAGCPTCIGRHLLGIKKPFFKMFRPKTKSKYARYRKTGKTLSYRKTNTNQLNNFLKKSIEKNKGAK